MENVKSLKEARALIGTKWWYTGDSSGKVCEVEINSLEISMYSFDESINDVDIKFSIRSEKRPRWFSGTSARPEQMLTKEEAKALVIERATAIFKEGNENED